VNVWSSSQAQAGLTLFALIAGSLAFDLVHFLQLARILLRSLRGVQ
jgi:hypothetical protein